MYLTQQQIKREVLFKAPRAVDREVRQVQRVQYLFSNKVRNGLNYWLIYFRKHTSAIRQSAIHLLTWKFAIRTSCIDGNFADFHLYKEFPSVQEIFIRTITQMKIPWISIRTMEFPSVQSYTFPIYASTYSVRILTVRMEIACTYLSMMDGRA